MRARPLRIFGKMKQHGAPRPGRPEDAEACADILNDWIDAREWMPRIHTRDDVLAFYRDFVFQEREVWVVEEPVEGFMALDRQAACVTALYTSNPGRGHGKRLLDHAKSGRNRLELWTFQANGGARRFYAREGFREVKETAGENEEGLPDVLLRWDRWPIRVAETEDAGTCARIVHDWVRRTSWIEELHTRDALTAMIAEAMPKRDIFLIGEPPAGYLSLNLETSLIGAFYLDAPGQGMGKAILDHVKDGRDYLQLWTHEPNKAAQRFYAREGFEPVERNPKGDDGLPEIRMVWRRSAADRQ
ncbi:MAG: hypothetical protein QNJ20_10215 [Paracoccaceae bacterium]|nr:hypothetical protein [Paracoccaceae bacterium]